MKIGILGAQGVGKTALAQALAKELGYPRIPEIAREILKEMGLKSPRELKGQDEKGKTFQLSCLSRQIAEERRYPRGFVSDRTVLDNVVYWLKWHSRRATSSENMAYYKTVQDHVKTYDLLVYVPPGIFLVDDGVRSTSKEYQAEIDMLLQLFLHSWGQNYITVSAATGVEHRVNEVIATLHESGV